MQNDKWEFYQDKKEEWRWRRTATNGNVVGASTEGYKGKASAVSNAEHYGYDGKFNSAGKWELYQDAKKEWRWRHTATNGNIIGASCQGYVNKADAVANAERHGATKAQLGL